MTGIAYPSLCMACSVGEHRGPGEGGVCECACHRPARAAGIDPSALTSDETVTAAFEAFNTATAVPFEAMRAALRAAALAAQGTGGDDAGEAAARNEFGRVTSWLQGQGCDVRAWLGRADDYAAAYTAFLENWAATAPASSSTQEGRRDGE